jgi:hypothetical protein
VAAGNNAGRLTKSENQIRERHGCFSNHVLGFVTGFPSDKIPHHTMWTSHVEDLKAHRGTKISILRDSSPVPYLEVLKLWEDDAPFRSFFFEQLASSPFGAFRWETPPITLQARDRVFEFVLLDSPSLAQAPDVHAFAEHFSKTDQIDVVEFSNLSGDAVLVVPSPMASLSAYGHLAAFVREAPASQQHALWRMVGAAMSQRIRAKTVWLNTAGAGVSWLHVRLDDRPKYYGYAPYQSMR